MNLCNIEIWGNFMPRTCRFFLNHSIWAANLIKPNNPLQLKDLRIVFAECSACNDSNNVQHFFSLHFKVLRGSFTILLCLCQSSSRKGMWKSTLCRCKWSNSNFFTTTCLNVKTYITLSPILLPLELGISFLHLLDQLQDLSNGNCPSYRGNRKGDK